MWHEVFNFKSICLQEIRLLENGVALPFPSVVTQILQKVDSGGFDLWQIVPDNILNILRAINVVGFPPLQHQRTSLLAHLVENTFQLNYDTFLSHAHWILLVLFETTSGEFKRGLLILGALAQSPRAAGNVCLLLILVKGGLNLFPHLLVFDSTILLSLVNDKCNNNQGRMVYLRKPPLQTWQTPFLNGTLWKQQP